MDIFFHDPDDLPLPPNEVKIRQFAAQPYPDGRRVRVYLEVTPFQKKPSAEIFLFNPLGEQMGNVSIIETIDPRMEMTMHLRGATSEGTYSARADLFYEELPEETNGQTSGSLTEYKMPERVMVDHAEVSFEIHDGE
jgi:hypothetical protein